MNYEIYNRRFVLFITPSPQQSRALQFTNFLPNIFRNLKITNSVSFSIWRVITSKHRMDTKANSNNRTQIAYLKMKYRND